MASRYNKNASTFNPFDSSVGTQKDIDDFERQQKKDKQNFYKDQLDQMGSKPVSRNAGHHEEQYQGYEQRRTPQQYAGAKKNVSNNNENDFGVYFGQQHDENMERDRKRRLQEEMTLANKKQIQQKEAQKRRDQAQELEADKVRIQDSLYQFEQDNMRQKQQHQKLTEDNNRHVQQQRKEYQHNQGHDDYSYNSKPLASRNNQQYDSDPYYGQDRQHGKQHGKQDNDMRGIMQQGYVSSQQKSRDADESDRRQNVSSRQGNAQSDYQKIRDNVRHGAAYNIISGNDY